MTFYEGRRGSRGYDDVHETPVVQPAAGRAPAAPPVTTDWSSHRRARPADVILPRTLARLRALPDDAKPHALVAQFPRVANLLALHWDDEAACPAYFEALLTDHRGGRQGFPQPVRDELAALRDFWFRARIG